MPNLNYKPKYPVLTLEKALDIIHYLKDNSSAEGISISELSENLKFAKSSVHRILDTLLAYNFVEKSDNGMSYRLGWGLFDAGNAVPEQHTLNSLDFVSVAEKLCDEFAETVNVAVLSNFEVVTIYKSEPNVRIRSNLQVGSREPLYCTALGKLFMSELSDDEIRDYYRNNEIRANSKNTITNAEDMIKEVQKVRQLGYSVDNEELCDGLACTAMPVRDFKGKIACAISISGPVKRMTSEKLQSIRKSLAVSCQELSAFMGYK